LQQVLDLIFKAHLRQEAMFLYCKKARKRGTI